MGSGGKIAEPRGYELISIAHENAFIHPKIDQGPEGIAPAIGAPDPYKVVKKAVYGQIKGKRGALNVFDYGVGLELEKIVYVQQMSPVKVIAHAVYVHISHGVYAAAP